MGVVLSEILVHLILLDDLFQALDMVVHHVILEVSDLVRREHPE